MAELFVADNLLDACRGWQEVIDVAEDKTAAGQAAVDSLHVIDGYHGANRVIVNTSRAYALPDGLTQEEAIWPIVSFNEMRILGNFARVSMVQFDDEAALSWMVTGALPVDPQSDLELQNLLDLGIDDDSSVDNFDYYLSVEEPTTRPLYLPVSSINFVLCAN